jgi:hypothetical protein
VAPHDRRLVERPVLLVHDASRRDLERGVKLQLLRRAFEPTRVDSLQKHAKRPKVDVAIVRVRWQPLAKPGHGRRPVLLRSRAQLSVLVVLGSVVRVVHVVRVARVARAAAARSVGGALARSSASLALPVARQPAEVDRRRLDLGPKRQLGHLLPLRGVHALDVAVEGGVQRRREPRLGAVARQRRRPRRTALGRSSRRAGHAPCAVGAVRGGAWRQTAGPLAERGRGRGREPSYVGATGRPRPR